MKIEGYMRVLLLVVGFCLSLFLSACSGGGSSGKGKGGGGPKAITYTNMIEGEDFPVDMSPCTTCLTIGTWTLVWNESAGAISGEFRGPWGSIPVSGTIFGGVISMTATPTSPLPPLGVDEINFTVPATYSSAEEGDTMPIDIQVKAGTTDVTGPVSTIYSTVMKKANGDTDVVIETPPVDLSDFATVRGKYTGMVTAVFNKKFPEISDSANNPRGWNHGSWVGKDMCDLHLSNPLVFTYTGTLAYQTKFDHNSGGSSMGNSMEEGSTPANFELNHNIGYPSPTLGKKDGFLISNAHSPQINFETEGRFTENDGKIYLNMFVRVIYKYTATQSLPAFEENVCSFDISLERIQAY